LPNKTKEQVCREMEDALLASPNLNKDNFKLTFTYRHDCSVIDPNSELPQKLLKSNLKCGVNSKIDAMTASCDVWFYNNILKIPTVVYGPGTLKVAHSKEEHIRLDEIKGASLVLYDFVMNFKGEK
jgi:acetylornithine deacetylase